MAHVILNRRGDQLPFNSSSDLSNLSAEIRTDYRPLALRNELVGDVFRIQAAVLRYFREYLASSTSPRSCLRKSWEAALRGHEPLRDQVFRSGRLSRAESPILQRARCRWPGSVFETGHVYRAEPHATSRHLTEYYSLDLEMGFIDGPEDVIELERELLTFIFGE